MLEHTLTKNVISHETFMDPCESQGPSRTVQKAKRCPRPESFALSSYWTDCRLCSVVDRVEENVGEGGSRSS